MNGINIPLDIKSLKIIAQTIDNNGHIILGDHPTKTEQYDWRDRNATSEDVSKKEKISCQIIQTILDRQIDIEVDWEKITDIEILGIDEIAIKKWHRSYLAVISAKTQKDLLRIIAKIKVAKRRCYGFVKVTTISQRLFLDL